MNKSSNVNNNSEKSIEELKRQIAEMKAQHDDDLAKRDAELAHNKTLLANVHNELANTKAELAEAHTEIDTMHSLIEEHSLISVNGAMLNQAIIKAEALRASMMPWFTTGEELTTGQRQRLNGNGVRRLGFTVKVLDLMHANPQFTPEFLDVEQFETRVAEMQQARSLSAVLQQDARIANDVLLVLGDESYRMALTYYGAVREAASRRVPGARELFLILQSFFRRGRRDDVEPTEAEVERDMKALLHGRKDGEIIVRNEAARSSGGVHEVADTAHKPHAAGAFKVTGDEKID